MTRTIVPGVERRSTLGAILLVVVVVLVLDLFRGATEERG
jgi:hypothetical protein